MIKYIPEQTNLDLFADNAAALMSHLNSLSVYENLKDESAKEFNNAIIVTLGTGIGGGIIIDNELFRGKSGAGAEIGHIKLHTHTKRNCTCGSKDCFESYASGTGLRITLQEEASSNPDFKNSVLSSKKITDLTTFDLVDAYKKGDNFAKQIFGIWHKQIAEGLLSLNNVFDTDIFVLSGSMAEFVDFGYLENYVNSQTVTTQTKVKKAEFDNNSGMVGAALLALKKYEK